MLKKVQVPFLKKRTKKSVQEMKLISQKKSNTFFLGGLLLLLLLSGITIFVAFDRVVVSPDESKQVAVSADKTDSIDNRMQLFFESYLVAYFNYDPSNKELYQESVNSFYESVPDIRSTFYKKEEMKLVSYRLVQILAEEAIYRVTYESLGNRITVLFGIPYTGTDGEYAVTGLPYFEAVSDYKSQNIGKAPGLSLSATDHISESDRAVLVQFVELFFKNYTTSQENLDIVSKGIKTVNGLSFNKLDYSYFKIGKAGKITAYVQASFEVLGTTYSQNFTLEIIKKDDGSFYVENMLRKIPSDYSQEKGE